MNIGLISIGFPNFRYDYGQKYLERSIEKLSVKDKDNIITSNTILITEEDIFAELNRIEKANIDLLIVQCGTYSFGSAMMKIIEQFRHTPLLIWGFTEPIIDGFRGLPLNSLCGLNMFGSFLKKVEKRFSYVYGDVEDTRVYEKVTRTIEAIRIQKTLKDTRFCIIGGRVPGFYLSNVDELNFRHEIGPEINYYSIASFLADANAMDKDLVKSEVTKMKGEVNRITTTEEMLEKSARMYLAIKAYKDANNIDAFTIKCWPELQSLNNCSICGVISRLNNEGIMTACEGDITGLTTMYIQHMITEKPCFFADLVNINKDGIYKTWHCGPAPICLARDHKSTMYTEHPTIKQGMGFATEFKMQLGRLTMIKLSEGKNGYRLFMAQGEGIEEDRDLVANQADIRFDTDPEKLLDVIMNHGIEHHYAIVYEDIKDELMELCKWMDIDTIVC